MKKTQQLLGIAALALLFGSAPVQAQTSSGTAATGGSSAQSGSTAGSDKAASSKSSGSKSSLSKSDQNVMRDIAHANLSEIAAAELALKQSQNDQVKTFAQKMIDDHGTAQKELEQMAQSKGVTLPTEPDTKHKAAMKTMGALEGEKFDKMYMTQGGTRDHKNTHQMLTKAQKNVKDPELKAYVQKITPIVDQHLSMAQDQRGKKETSSGSSGGSSSKSDSGSSGSSSSKGSGSSGAGSSAGTGSGGTAGSTTSTSPGGSAPSGSSGVSGTSGSSNSGGGSR